MSSCSQVCCRSLSCSLELLADRQRSSEHRGRHNLPSTNEGLLFRYIVDKLRAVDYHGAGLPVLQVVPERHSRPSWNSIHYVLPFPYGTDGFHLDIPKDGKAKAMKYYGWRVTQRDGRA